jgi:hypothetical protein
VATIAVLITAAAAAGSAAPSGRSTPERSSAAPVERSQPTIEGTVREGRTLTAGNGTWDNSPTSFRYQWQRCGPDGSGCQDRPGETRQTYLIRGNDVDNTLRLLVTACNADGCSTPANSKPTPLVSGNGRPRNDRRPEISGKAEVGQTLTGSVGRWREGPTEFALQWRRCNSDGRGCASIVGATTSTYTIRSEDGGSRFRFQVTARNVVGTTTAESQPTAVVPRAPSGPAGGSGWFEPPAIRSRDETFVARFRVTDTRGFAVRDALVYVIGVPANRIPVEGERTTDVDGWATFTFRPLRGLPMVRGATLVLFVRARKPGENILAGVSTRRLVSVRVDPRR